ncbi:MAG: hypothetical protein RMK29_04215 [Myxococcales bacterium]|nr:hypothetical protein [Myxococcales bacterium]
MPRLLIAPLGGNPPPPCAAQLALEQRLIEEGVHIDHAATAQQALEGAWAHDLLILTQDKTSDGAPLVAEGVLALRRRAAQQGRRHLPVLMLSAAPEHDAAHQARHLGADDVLSLSLPPQLACSRVRAYLALAASSSPPPASTPPQTRSVPWHQDLTRRLVHDLRNPLAGLTSNLSYIEDRLGQSADPEVLEALADCRAAVARLRRAAAMLVDLGPLEQGTLRPRLQQALLAPLLQDLLDQRLHEASLRQLRLVADVPPGHVAAFDPELLPRLLHALLDHALRYAQAGSQVLLRVLADTPGRLTLRLEAAGAWLPRDHGGHLPSGVVEVGLALHYAHLVAQAHGGSIQVLQEASPDRGQQTVAVVIV